MTKPGDRVPPPPPTPRFSQRELAAQYVGDILRQKAEEAAQARAAPPPRPRGARALMVLVPILLGLTGWNLGRLMREPAVFSPEEAEAGLRFRMYLAAEAVRAYRDSARALPATLEDLGLDEDEGLVYAPIEDTFIITGVDGPVRLTYRGDQDPAPFAAAYDVVAGSGGGGGGPAR